MMSIGASALSRLDAAIILGRLQTALSTSTAATAIFASITSPPTVEAIPVPPSIPEPTSGFTLLESVIQLSGSASEFTDARRAAMISAVSAAIIDPWGCA